MNDNTPGIDVDAEDIPEKFDPRSVRILAVFDRIAETLERLNQEEPALAETEYTQQAVDGLVAAFRVGERVLDSSAYPAEFLANAEALDDDLLADARTSLVRVGVDVYDMDMGLEPIRDASGPDPQEYLALGDGRWT
jgi:hypothetical protein